MGCHVGHGVGWHVMMLILWRIMRDGVISSVFFSQSFDVFLLTRGHLTLSTDLLIALCDITSQKIRTT